MGWESKLKLGAVGNKRVLWSERNQKGPTRFLVLDAEGFLDFSYSFSEEIQIIPSWIFKSDVFKKINLLYYNKYYKNLCERDIIYIKYINININKINKLFIYMFILKIV